MKKIILAIVTSAAIMGCASKGVNVAGITTDAVGTTSALGTSAVRTPASAIVNNDGLQVDLRDVAALLKGYFTVKKPDNSTTIVGYSAYVLSSNDVTKTGRVIVYLDDPAHWDKQLLAVDNDKFLYVGGPLAGDEPSMATNRKDSLLIQSGNDSGRYPWHETVTVALRGGQLVVAGYDTDSMDRFGEEAGHSCSVNYLTGRGVATVNPPISKDGKSKLTKFSVTTGILLKDWTENSKPKQCDPNN